MTQSLWLGAFVVAVGLFQLVSIPALLLKKNDLADVLWGPAFPLAAILGAMVAGRSLPDFDSRKWIVLAMLVLWGARLFMHVGWRNLSHAKEDVRYNNWRKQWGKTWVWRSYLQVFVLQAAILFLFLLPVLHVLDSPAAEIGPIGFLGIAVWVTGFFFEAVSDEQLRRFKKIPENRGKLMTKGLWAWSRHPNYFGEVVLWWGIWVMAMENPSAWWTIIGPLGVTYLILRVSGVSMLDSLMKNRPGYDAYVKSVPAFVPGTKR